jgi:hypothetical protein
MISKESENKSSENEIDFYSPIYTPVDWKIPSSNNEKENRSNNGIGKESPKGA